MLPKKGISGKKTGMNECLWVTKKAISTATQATPVYIPTQKSSENLYLSGEEPAMASIIEETKLTTSENNRAGSQPSTENPGTS